MNNSIFKESAEEPTEETSKEEVDEVKEYKLISAFEDLSQEIRRVGREVFKTNRASERNQEIFNESLSEIRHLSSVISQIPAQNVAGLSDAEFAAKAGVCRELLRVAD